MDRPNWLFQTFNIERKLLQDFQGRFHQEELGFITGLKSPRPALGMKSDTSSVRIIINDEMAVND